MNKKSDDYNRLWGQFENLVREHNELLGLVDRIIEVHRKHYKSPNLGKTLLSLINEAAEFVDRDDFNSPR